MQQYTLDPHAKKLSRKALFGLLEKYAVNDEQLSKQERDSLLVSLAPQPRTPKNAMEWLSKAVAKHDVRSYLEYIYVESGVAYATNGHFVLSANAVGFEDGFYCPKTFELVSLDKQYPAADIECVLETEAFEIRNLCPEKAYMETSQFFIYRIGDRVFNCKYLDIVRCWTTKPKFYFTEKGNLLMKDVFGRRAAVMPIVKS